MSDEPTEQPRGIGAWVRGAASRVGLTTAPSVSVEQAHRYLPLPTVTYRSIGHGRARPA